MLWLADSEHSLPADPGWLAPAERRRADAMRFTKRRNDYLLGRWVGKRAVAEVLGLPSDPAALAVIAITNAEDGAPEVRVDGEPVSLGISLTDRAGWGVCAVGDGAAALGCDLELVEPRSRLFVDDYFTASERAWLESSTGSEEWDVRANLVWSAKESALKVLRSGLRRDTRDVEVATEEAAAGGWAPLRVRVADGAVFPGWWQRFGDFVLSFAAACEAPPPACLREPPPLAGATPSHAWLERPVVPEATEQDLAPGPAGQRGAT